MGHVELQLLQRPSEREQQPTVQGVDLRDVLCQPQHDPAADVEQRGDEQARAWHRFKRSWLDGGGDGGTTTRIHASQTAIKTNTFAYN